MTSVLHPVGPEPAETYWARRVALLIALVVLVGLVVAVVVNSTSSGSAVSADPVPPPVTAPPATSPSPSASPSPSPSPSTSPSATASASSSARTAATPAPKASKAARAPAGASPSPKPTPTGPVACRPKELRATLTGKQRLKPEQKSTFTLSLINGSDATCVVSVTPENFELKIYSGTDRIWTTDDCSTAVKKRSTTVRAEDAVVWTMTWDGARSRQDCRTRPEVPRPGTYFATAQLDGAEPVQLRMILGG
ncbi:hypothetical protein SAMN04488543_0397 [Friedmanniella luteola]|uniref:Uncharacterized protein n=1 Tax=Friedmanniella luteola TaxID=546871 RepID=A0A1H1LR20_9ACTN|nr:hypothetical protein [Friedmanniella luteola]SDR77001.1 hypothetical protein SAMN04488543_0397 [Friedmanniella luteola]